MTPPRAPDPDPEPPRPRAQARGQSGSGVTEAPAGRIIAGAVPIAVVIAVALAEVGVRSWGLRLAAALALMIYFGANLRRLNLASRIPLALAALATAAAAKQGLPANIWADALDRMIFLAALLALLAVLRAAATLSPAVIRAGRYLTRQPPGRRYLALTTGGHVFGVLINLGGVAILLDMARRAWAEDSAHLPPHLRELRLRRMSVAVLRGFSLVAMWSPFGFAVNALLLALPGLHYGQILPLGLAATVLFAALGWVLDQRTRLPAHGPAASRSLRSPQALAPPPVPEPGGARALGQLVAHVLALAAAVFGLAGLSGMGFQQALLSVLPVYALGWVLIPVLFGARQPVAALGGFAMGAARGFAQMQSELAVFASDGLLAVLVPALLPLDQLDLAALPWRPGPVLAVPLMMGALFGLCCVGINPIISSSILASILAELAIPGLSHAAIALSLTGAWSAVMGFSPFITTVAFAAALIGRDAVTVGVRWNGVYSLMILGLWAGLMMALVASGMV